MPRPIHAGRFRARATPEHRAILPTEIPIPADKRNPVPASLDGLSWYICTTAPQQERRAGESLRREADKLADRGLQPLVPYAPCATHWRERTRNGLRLPRLEVQTPLLRSYLFVGVEGSIEDGHLGVMSERNVERQNKHGLLSVLGIGWERKPVALNAAAVAFLAKLAGEEIATGSGMAARSNREAAGGFEAGQAVRLTTGPLSGFGGTVEAIDAMKGRMLVTVAMFGRMSPIELSFGEAVAA